MLFFGRLTNYRIRRALALTQLVEQRQLVRRHSQHVTFLGLVTPDLQRAHTRLIAEDVTQFEFTAASTVTNQFRHRVRQTAGANVVDKQDRVGVTQLPAAVDHFLAAAFHLRVITLYRGKIKIRVRLAGGHRGSRAAAQADIHRRTAENDQLRPDDDLAFLYVIGTDVTNPARQHDRLVITAQLFAIVAVHFFFVSTEIAVQRRTTKFIVKRRAAQRAFSHDIQRGHNTLWLAEVFFPRLLKARNAQVRNGEAYQTRFWLRAASGCPFITDFTAGTSRRPRPRRDRRRVVMGFHLHQDMRRLLVEVIATGRVVGKVTPHFRPFHHRRVIFIRGKHVVRCGFKGVFDHLEQRLRLLLAIDDPVGVENLVTAVLRVRLRKHVEFDVVRVAPQSGKRVLQVINFVIRQRQTETQVSINQRLTAFTQQVNTCNRRRLMVSKQFFRIG